MPHSDYHTSPSGAGPLGNPLLARRSPLDVRLVALVGIALGTYAGLFTVLLIIGIAEPTPSIASLPTLLQYAGLRGKLSVCAYCALQSVMYILSGVGILRVRRWGWWLLLVSTLLGTAINAVDSAGFVAEGIIGLAMDAGLLTWLVLRSKLYRPLGGGRCVPRT